MITATEPFDPAELLRSPKEVQVYLADMLAHGDAGMIAAALGVAARAHGMTDLAKATGVPRATLYRALSADGNPTLALVLKVLDGLGLGLTIAAKPESTEDLIG